jgi:hypothetical protein
MRREIAGSSDEAQHAAERAVLLKKKIATAETRPAFPLGTKEAKDSGDDEATTDRLALKEFAFIPTQVDGTPTKPTKRFGGGRLSYGDRLVVTGEKSLDQEMALQAARAKLSDETITHLKLQGLDARDYDESEEPTTPDISPLGTGERDLGMKTKETKTVKLQANTETIAGDDLLQDITLEDLKDPKVLNQLSRAEIFAIATKPAEKVRELSDRDFQEITSKDLKDPKVLNQLSKAEVLAIATKPAKDSTMSRFGSAIKSGLGRIFGR